MGRLIRLIGSRLAQAILVAGVVSTLCFALAETLPGDKAYRIAAGRYGIDLVSTEAAEAVRAELGLDRPWWQRLGSWYADIATGNLGVSLVYSRPVVDELTHQLGATIELSILALLISVLIGPPLGFLMAWRAGRFLDIAGLVGATALRAVPSFALGVLLMLGFAVWLPLLPAAGADEPFSWVIPAGTLALGIAAVSSRVARDAALAAMQSPAVGFALTRGLSLRQAIRHHVVRNALAPVVTYLGIQLVVLIEGVVVIESLFSWPGIGHALVHAVVARDIPMLQGTALSMGLMFVTLNMLIDAACLALDPRGRKA
jgi:peptide/nickel transport system permease protein